METEGISTKSTIIKCPFCGELLPPLTKVCPSCGQIVEEQNSESNANSMMSEIDGIYANYSCNSIRIYDYILLLVPIFYLIWAFVVIKKIIKANRLYNDFMTLSSKALTLYGENYRFRNYLTSKTAEIEEIKRKCKKSHIIIYTLLFVDVLLLCISLAN